MRKEVVVLAAMALALAGCGRTPFPVMEAQLEGLKGQPAKEVIRRLGDPNSTEQIAGEKAYVWTSASNGSYLGAAANAVDFDCTVRVFVDKDENISHYEFKGNVGGCAHYAHRLDKTYNLIRWNVPAT
jgi:hypothetical protein